MHFRLTHSAGVIAMLVIALFSVVRSVSGDLGLYIHPRYFAFTISMSILAVFFVCLARIKSTEKLSKFSIAASVAVFALVLLPPAVLSSRLADTRAGSGALALKANPQKLVITSRNSEKLTFEDWASLLAQDPSGGLVVGKKVKVSGFVRATERENILALSRFVVTCCAVDARPIEIFVVLPGWQKIYTVDSWLEVKGEFEQVDGSLVLKPTEHYAIEEPESPYAY